MIEEDIIGRTISKGRPGGALVITSAWAGVYFFSIALVLALLEIQIEGPHGWAARLPTWRWASRRVRGWLENPVTGYHVFLNLFILLLLHLPLVVVGASIERESEILSLYFLLCVSWDFLWFVCNPHFGLRRFKPGHVWWFQGWWLGIPVAYFSGIAISAAIWILAAAPGTHRAKAATWLMLFLEIAGLVAATLTLNAVRRRVPRAGRGIAVEEESAAGR